MAFFSLVLVIKLGPKRYFSFSFRIRERIINDITHRPISTTGDRMHTFKVFMYSINERTTLQIISPLPLPDLGCSIG